MKTEPKLGQLAPDAQRDAVHVAVIPVVATVKVYPGQRVNAAGVPSDKPVGIVDPYLETAVFPGERYFLCLFPGTVTSLRHEWTHPSFEDVLRGERGEDGMKAASEQWLREYAQKLSIYDSPEEAYQRLIKGLDTGWLTAHGTDLYSFDGLDHGDELQHHAGIVLGRPVNLRDFSFSCSC